MEFTLSYFPEREDLALGLVDGIGECHNDGYVSIMAGSKEETGEALRDE